MNRNILIAIIVRVLVLLGGAAWYFTSSDSDDSVSQIFSSDEITDFLNPYAQPVTMTATVVDPADAGNEGTFTMQFQDDDTWSMVMNTSEGEAQIVYDGDFSYLQNPEDGSWLKIPIGDDVDSPADDFTISDNDIADFRNNAVSTGQSSCSLGTCSTFDYTDPATGETATLKIGSGGRIAEMVAVSGTSTITMVFDYDAPVNIQTPADAVEFGIPQ